MIKGLRRFVVGWLAAAALCASAPRPAVGQVADPAASARFVTLRLRVEWGGGAARRWNVVGEMPRGELRDPAPLGIEPDEPGSMWIDEGRWRVEPRTPRTYDGADLTIAAPRDEMLVVTLIDVDGAAPSRHEIPVRSLLEGAYHGDLDDSGNRLVVRRAPGDRLRVEFSYPSLIFSPGEVLEMHVRPHQLGLPPGAALQLTATLSPARRSDVLWSGTTELTAPADDGAWPAVPVTIRLPEGEGVYDVALETTRGDRRRVQLVVLSPEPPPRRAEPDPALSHELMEIDPSSPGWSERLKQMTTLPGQRRAPLGNVRTTVRTIDRATYAELPPTAEPADPAWQAYPLVVARPGTPHIVELEYPSDVAQSLSVSLVEPNALGAVTPLGVDTGLYVDPLDVEPTSRRLSRRFLVWPRTTSPLLVVTNRRRDAAAVYGKIRLYGARGAGVVPYLSRGGDAAPSLSVPPRPDARSDARLAAAYYDRPLFPENFGASTFVDRADDGTERCLDDWVTYYEGAARLIDYLQHVGYNGLLVTVVADGSAIYPTALIEPTPRYDDGAFFSTAQDPIRKDVVELLLRLCDREGIRFIAGVQFSAPLPRLEALRRAGAAEIEPLGLDGRTWNDVHANDGGPGPRYNPLDPRVQNEMLRIVAELTNRYGSRRSWGGAAVHLSADGYALLPGVEWCLDEATIARFAAETRIPLRSDLPLRDAAQLVVGRYRDTWLAWRKAVLTRLYDHMAHAATADDPTRRLVLVAAHAWQRDDLQQQLRPGLTSRPDLVALLADRGLDPAALVERPFMQWLRPYADGPLDAPATFGPSIAMNRHEGLDAAAAALPSPAALVYHEPQLQRLESLERQSPFQPAYVRQVVEAAAGGSAGRRRLVRQLAALDSQATFVGGWLLPLGEENGVRRVASVMQSLPAERFTTIEGGPSHVVVRSLSRDGRTYLYVVNDAPWPTTVTLDVAAPPETTWRSTDGDAAKSELRDDAGRRVWRTVLEPYDVVGGAFSHGDATLSNVQAAVPDDVAERLGDEIRNLWARCGHLQQAPLPLALTNGDFEASSSDGRTIPGWQTTPGAEVRLTTAQPFAGRQAVRLTSAVGGDGLISSPLPPLRCGRAVISVRLRAVEGDLPPVRLTLEGRRFGRAYSRSASLGGDGAAVVGSEWRQFVFPLTDLPAAGLADVRLRCELTAPGEIELDDVAVSELEFSAAERLELTKTISSIELRLQRGELGECARLLEGYWPRFLTAYVPLDEAGSAGPGRTPIAVRPHVRPPAAEATPGVRDRLKKWLPEFLR